MQRETLYSAAELLSKLPAGRYCGLGEELLLLTFYSGPADLFQPKWIRKLRLLAELGDYTRPICLVGRLERSSICLVPRVETPNSRTEASEVEAFADELAAALKTLQRDPQTPRRSAPQIIVGSPVEAMRLVQILNRHVATELLEGVTVNWHSCGEPVSALQEQASVPLPNTSRTSAQTRVPELASV